MTTLSEMPFETLRAGMVFQHPSCGRQVILDLGQGAFGPAITFDSCDLYSGRMPPVDLEEEGDIFEVLARSIYPYGADEWQYLGMVSPEEVSEQGWHWFQVICPHCGFAHHLLAETAPPSQRHCLACGMAVVRPAEPIIR